jgi:hypothetical protein
LTRAATFVFDDFPVGEAESYLLDIRSAGGYVFAPYRVDVAADGSILGIWETFRGNPWDNRGAEKYIVDVSKKTGPVDVVVEAKVVGRKAFYEERAKCELEICFALVFAAVANASNLVSPLSLVKSPMVLLAIVAMGLMFVMPKLMENSMSTGSADCSRLTMSSGPRDARRVRAALSFLAYHRCHEQCHGRWRLRSGWLDGRYWCS